MFERNASSALAPISTDRTATRPSRSISRTVKPPNAAMYWSCFPIPFPSTSSSRWHASSASAAAVTGVPRYRCSARRSPTRYALDEPSPVPAGRSAIDEISIFRWIP